MTRGGRCSLRRVTGHVIYSRWGSVFGCVCIGFIRPARCTTLIRSKSGISHWTYRVFLPGLSSVLAVSFDPGPKSESPGATGRRFFAREAVYTRTICEDKPDRWPPHPDPGSLCKTPLHRWKSCCSARSGTVISGRISAPSAKQPPAAATIHWAICVPEPCI